MTGRNYHVIFDGPPAPEAGRFVEIEGDSGESICAGEWKQRERGFWDLVLPAPTPRHSGLLGDIQAIFDREDLETYLGQHPRLFVALLEAVGTPSALATRQAMQARFVASLWLQEAENSSGGIQALMAWAELAKGALADPELGHEPYRAESGSSLPPNTHGLVFRFTDCSTTFPAYIQLCHVESPNLETALFLALRWRLQGSVDATVVEMGAAQTLLKVCEDFGEIISKAVFGKACKGRVFFEAPRMVVGGEAPNYGTDTPAHMETPFCWWTARAL